jgi:hypothetical protein
MTDLTAQLLPKLKSHRIPGLDLGDGFQYPRYDGYSILNIPASVCQLLGAPGIDTAAGALAPEILAPLGRTFQRVILVLMDGLALHRLQDWMGNGDAPAWDGLAKRGLLAPLTSITPSTTSAALTAYWTGRSAAEHGTTGYEMWLKEFGVVANTILLSPMSVSTGIGSLEDSGYKPEVIIPFKTLGQHLTEQEIHVYAMQHYNITDSGLSRTLYRGAKVLPFSTFADAWINLRQLTESRPAEKQFIWLYWGEVDHFSHFYGPDDERTVAEFSLFTNAMQRLFLDKLSPAARKDTLLILTADHGEILTTKADQYDLRHHPDLVQRLHIYPAGEHRLAYLYPRHGQLEAVRDYVARAWPGQFAVLDSPAAVEKGLFGPGTPHPRLLERVGDLTLAARDNAYLWWSDKENRLIGRHGGLHPQEMLVPFLAAPLG